LQPGRQFTRCLVGQLSAETFEGVSGPTQPLAILLLKGALQGFQFGVNVLAEDDSELPDSVRVATQPQECLLIQKRLRFWRHRDDPCAVDVYGPSQLFRNDRLGEDFVDPHAETCLAGRAIAIGSHCDNGHGHRALIRFPLPDPSGNFYAVDTGHSDIQEDQIDRALLQHL
jgi:hypothetical protein